MSNSSLGEHLPPNIFVDLLESAPVETAWLKHIESCRECRDELGELKSVWAMIVDDESPNTVREVAQTKPRILDSLKFRIPKSRFVYGLAVAATLVISAIAVQWTLNDEEVSTSVESANELLPLYENDVEFQLLLSFVGAIEANNVIDALEEYRGSTIDIELLSGDQQQEFMEELAKEMRAES